MINIKTVLLTLTCLVLVACSDNQVYDSREPQNIYVDSSSLAPNSLGTIEEPIKSLEQLNELMLVPGDRVLFKRGTTYRGQLLPKSGNEDHVIYYGDYDQGDKPILLGSIEANHLDDWLSLPNQENIYKLNRKNNIDIGNIIFNNGQSFGVKKWSMTDLGQDGDYYFDPKSKDTYLYMDKHPSYRYEDIECAITQSIIDETQVSYVTYENLELKYGGGHGIGGGRVSHITIRNLTISYIGGGFLYKEDDKYIQYGNGIEFWSYATDILVEECEIFEIFDTGVTNQNNTKKAIQERITYRHNYIYNCGMASIEIDNAPKEGNTEDIIFEYNICENVGLGWGVTQDRYNNLDYNLGLGHHIIIFYMETPLKNLSIKHNTFDHAYHPDGYSSIYLFVELPENILEEIIIEDNEIKGDYDSFGYLLQDGLVVPVEGF